MGEKGAVKDHNKYIIHNSLNHDKVGTIKKITNIIVKIFENVLIHFITI